MFLSSHTLGSGSDDDDIPMGFPHATGCYHFPYLVPFLCFLCHSTVFVSTVSFLLKLTGYSLLFHVQYTCDARLQACLSVTAHKPVLNSVSHRHLCHQAIQRTVINHRFVGATLCDWFTIFRPLFGFLLKTTFHDLASDKQCSSKFTLRT